ncbi:transposon Ty3-G Gag-Pol polyprotein [Nephila pilipes]|uniref:Transposon Ty3-G Gag-Pol polyprotein n=1 Tax=Nephila pilipes TaxID=299642 RepID=A0A8X6T1L4_NEPPI|nr:transposon Ty3-G Gag-Pol polyprotein [Nephila pilipes]
MTRHRIDTGNHLPIKQHPKRLPFNNQEEVANLLMEMQQNDIIKPSESSGASPIAVVRKKDGCTFEDNLRNIRMVLRKLKMATLKLNLSKCNLFRREVDSLGRIISAEVRIDPEKISAVKDWSRPEDVHLVTEAKKKFL